MPKSIAVVGAGPGLGRAVARRYAREGYTVVPIARRQEPLDALAAELTRAGATAHPLTADLSDERAVPRLAEQIRARVGSLDAIYYGPSVRGYIPVLDLTADQLRDLMPLAVYSLVDLVHEFLPDMLDRKQGAVLVAMAAGAVQGMPQLSGTAVLAAQRNYLQALQAEVTEQGVHVGRLYIGAVIEHSAFHQQQETARATGQPVLDMPVVDPDQLADLLWSMQSSTHEHEVLHPKDLFDRTDQSH
ncbi:SDR family NAD(P)-dependent oxidoreductase [Actinoallomurus soli]|uniref:SDR family NAD(P)-dependent oxidoreductase n=1 Tax=Actinoallomurus soli TaxID=2952535 RepID=UPI002093CD82|nr:SDR family NAD(P)-dependent oxidoreductase [Actinoallomurus soli]MCO5973865.1 SDR family NAD(P)-dependent oxidoreductase [Actinoallomurus soli]